MIADGCDRRELAQPDRRHDPDHQGGRRYGDDEVRDRRMKLAAAYRRLSDAALAAADACADDQGDVMAERSRAQSVDGRVGTVREARALLTATRAAQHRQARP